MSDAPSRYPLAWPAGRSRTPIGRRRYGTFKKGGELISRIEALQRVEYELGRLNGKYPLLSSNIELKMDGSPRANQLPPTDPGVCLYFEMDGKPFALACDTYTKVAQNVAAIAAHLEATRAIERYGVATAAETLQAFSALPPPPAGGSIILGAAVRPWYDVLGVAPAAKTAVIEAAFRALAKEAHPDRPGGSAGAMHELNQAREEGLRANG